jgi:hypothetical protein
MLNQYQQLTQLLLKDPKQERFNLADLATYINIARNQVSGEGECIRVLANISTGPQPYPFSGISVAGTPGAASVLSVRMISANGILLAPREWEWFNLYYIPAPKTGYPREWCQFGQGALGSIFVNPVPATGFVLSCDCACLPVPLASDATPEAIPYPWTDAVPYYAAYMAYLTAQDAVGAQNMLDLYTTFMARARAMATPTVLPRQYEMGHIPLGPAAQPQQQAAG